MKFEGRFWGHFKNGLTVLLALSFVVAFAGRFMPAQDRVPQGTTLPNFSMASLSNPGQKVTSAQLAGKGVLLHFWASWCSACKRGMPTIQQLHERYEDQGLVVLGVTDDNPNTIRKYLRDRGFTYPVAWDRRGRLGTQFKVRSIPFSVFFDRQGNVVADRTGALSEGDADELIQQILE